ncbi:MAG TPA: winged helix-turn-helix domain-containing protein [Solirubrobacterales bacterium]|jgi:DNA-binding transcriptional ArsR family regulator|nr:winged helix-turn-helix domain-containing protein [Solirubrobacterales bacterium]
MGQRKCEQPGMSAREVLGHPLRIRIVSACTLREMTVAELARRFKVSVSTMNRHLRRLVEAGYLRLRVESRRGVRKHMYRASRRATIADEEFAQMTMKQRRRASVEVLRDFFRHTWQSWEAGTLDERPDSHLTWTLMRLDEQGWTDVMSELATLLEACIEIQAASLVRLGESGGEPIPTTIALAGFKDARERPGQIT